ncbi:hypothetical protein D3C74_400410 [compost metagenome]
MLCTTRIQIGYAAVFDDGTTNGFACAECFFNGITITQVFQFGTYEGSAFTWFNVLEIKHGIDIVVYLHGQACFKIVY